MSALAAAPRLGGGERRAMFAAVGLLRTSAWLFCCRGSAKACNEAAPACREEREA